MESRETKLQKESEAKTLQNGESFAPFPSVSTSPITTLFFYRVRQHVEICVSISVFFLNSGIFYSKLIDFFEYPGSIQKFLVGNN